MNTFFFYLIWIFGTLGLHAQTTLGVLQYSGGGDWYANPTSLKNLMAFCNTEHSSDFKLEYQYVKLEDPELFTLPFLHLTGHGNIVFTDIEKERLRLYLEGGGFLHIDDNYGMDPYIRPLMLDVFPELQWVLLSPEHSLFQEPYVFPEGLPKIHEHDAKPPEALALFHNGRVICLYTYESDLGDGWEDQAVHGDPEEVRTTALKMGTNILYFAFRQ